MDNIPQITPEPDYQYHGMLSGLGQQPTGTAGAAPAQQGMLAGLGQPQAGDMKWPGQPKTSADGSGDSNFASFAAAAIPIIMAAL